LQDFVPGTDEKADMSSSWYRSLAPAGDQNAGKLSETSA
jgi:hypothetical protein